jgi:hypothetical protein
MRHLALIAALLALPGCDFIGNVTSGLFSSGPAIGVTPFRGTVDRGEDERDLTVLVEVTPDVPLDDFRESARYPVTRYCIEQFGSSEAAWETDPASGDWAVLFTERGAVLNARCTGRI